MTWLGLGPVIILSRNVRSPRAPAHAVVPAWASASAAASAGDAVPCRLPIGAGPVGMRTRMPLVRSVPIPAACTAIALTALPLAAAARRRAPS